MPRVTVLDGVELVETPMDPAVGTQVRHAVSGDLQKVSGWTARLYQALVLDRGAIHDNGRLVRRNPFPVNRGKLGACWKSFSTNASEFI